MPSKKKTNYISYEIKKLEKYFKQLEKYMDDNPPDSADDRIEHIETARGTAIKVICKKEEQIKLFKETLKELPALLENLNKLRMTVDGETEEDEVRGGHDMPGFMRKKKNSSSPSEPKKKEEVEFDDEDFEDDPLENSVENSATLFLPGSDELEAAKNLDEEEAEEEEYENFEDDPWDE